MTKWNHWTVTFSDCRRHRVRADFSGGSISTIWRRYSGAYGTRLSAIRTPPLHNDQVSTKTGQLQFVDFWNYTLLMRGIEAEFRTDWSQLGPALEVAAVGKIDGGAGADYQTKG